MSIENDPNIIYGGDPEETTRIDENCASLGEMVISDFKLGEDKPSFVSCVKERTLYRSKVKSIFFYF